MDNYVANVIPHLQQWWPVIIRLSYLAGLGFALTACVLAISGKHRFFYALFNFCAIESFGFFTEHTHRI